MARDEGYGNFHAMPLSLTIDNGPQVIIGMAEWQDYQKDQKLVIVLMALVGAARKVAPEDLPAVLYKHYFPDQTTPYIDFERHVLDFARKAQAEREADETAATAARKGMPA